jgi:hypothetical protein
VQVFRRHKNGIREGSVVIQNPDDSAMWTVVGHSVLTQVAFSATAIDFTNDALPGVGPRFGDAHKLVSQNSLKSHVTLDQLQVGFANAG